MPKHEPLTLDTLGRLQDGTVGAVVDSSIADILRDCDDRPSLKNPRKLTIEITAVPVQDDNGRVLKAVVVGVSVKKAVPAQKAMPEVLRIRLDGPDGEYSVQALMPEYPIPLFDRKEGQQ